jgi:hypothetical protein
LGNAAQTSAVGSIEAERGADSDRIHHPAISTLAIATATRELPARRPADEHSATDAIVAVDVRRLRELVEERHRRAVCPRLSLADFDAGVAVGGKRTHWALDRDAHWYHGSLSAGAVVGQVPPDVSNDQHPFRLSIARMGHEVDSRQALASVTAAKRDVWTESPAALLVPDRVVVRVPADRSSPVARPATSSRTGAPVHRDAT